MDPPRRAEENDVVMSSANNIPILEIIKHALAWWAVSFTKSVNSKEIPSLVRASMNSKTNSTNGFLALKTMTMK